MRALLALLVLLAGCAKAPEHDDAPLERRASVSQWLGHVRATHAAADGASSPEDKQRALSALRALAGGDMPEVLTPAEANAVRRDLYGRAVRLALDLQYLQLSEELTRDGLALEGDDPFRTQLLILAAQSYRALGHPDAEAKALELARRDLGLSVE